MNFWDSDFFVGAALIFVLIAGGIMIAVISFSAGKKDQCQLIKTLLKANNKPMFMDACPLSYDDPFPKGFQPVGKKK